MYTCIYVYMFIYLFKIIYDTAIHIIHNIHMVVYIPMYMSLSLSIYIYREREMYKYRQLIVQLCASDRLAEAKETPVPRSQI